MRRRTGVGYFRCFSTKDGAAAYKVLLGEEKERPPPDRTSLRKLYFHFARSNHPDVGAQKSSSFMAEGSSAYAVLKDASDDERRGALDELFLKPVKTETNLVRSYPPPPWEIRYEVSETEEEYRVFLKSLDGNDKLRFHRRWVDADGNRYRGQGETLAPSRQPTSGGAKSESATTSGTGLFLVYYLFQSWQ